MQYLLDAGEAGEVDRISIKKYGIPSVVLMERVAIALSRHVSKFVDRAVFGAITSECLRNSEILEKNSKKNLKILAICGMGNNGGDGVAAARILKEWGYDVSVFLMGDRKKASEEMKTQLAIAENLSMNFVKEADFTKFPILIDAMFGIGLSREVTGKYAECIKKMNESSSYIFSVDIPSGVSASTGAILGTAVRADETITFGAGKLGLFLYPGLDHAGKVSIEEIGFPSVAMEETAPKAFFYSRDELGSIFPKRKKNSHKGSYGKLLVIAGSDDISGAAYFSAKAAYLMGCGLVKVVTHRNNREMIQEKLPEALHAFYETEYSLEEDMNWATAVLLGPGLSKNDMAKKLLSQVLKIREKPVLLDADGLNLLAEGKDHIDKEEILLPKNFIITPHLLEMSRLMGVSVEEIKAAPLKYVRRTKCGAVLVLKDARTLVSNGEWVYVNLSGNHALAKGGSGDVLSGMIGGLLARGEEPFLAASLGVYLHGLTADEYIEHRSASSMLATDILEMLPRILP